MHPHIKTALVTLLWFPVLYAAVDYGFQPCRIQGMSMTPTFNPGTETLAKDVVLVRKFMAANGSLLSRGDIVMLRLPLNPEKLLTKRIVGVQGDTISPRAEYPRQKPTVVPRNHLWVEGDNAFHSIDSNTFGPVSLGLVVGKVVLVLWPLSRWGVDLSKGGRNALTKAEESND